MPSGKRPATGIAGCFLAALGLLVAHAAFASGQDGGDGLGKLIYRAGLHASGKPVKASLQNGVVLSGADAACAKCHRRSGLGGSEGRNTILPITGKYLFARQRSSDAVVSRVELRKKAPRPVYTRESLARTLREGVDPLGRALDPLMPRFDLNDDEIAQLASYLDRLSSAPDPGVTESEIHFATIVAPDVDPEKSAAMLDVLHAFFSAKNAGTRNEGRRKVAGSELMYRSYRTWKLHVWTLAGAPETWRGQLERFYRSQPVFAVLSGIGEGTWRPVHEFCEGMEIPCVFPSVDFPEVTETGYATVYFSRGATLEAGILARYLAEAGPGGKTGAVVQVFRDDGLGSVPAQALRNALQRRGVGVVERPVAGNAPVSPAFWANLLDSDRPDSLVLWLDDADIRSLVEEVKPPAGLASIYLSASLLAFQRPALPDAWLTKARLVSPFEPDAGQEQRLLGLKFWLRSKNIPLRDERIQANTYFAATLAGEVVTHMADNLTRDYFLERIEHMTGKSSSSSTLYPRLTLGPGQRFAAKGGYVAGFAAEAGNRLVPVSGWIVP